MEVKFTQHFLNDLKRMSSLHYRFFSFFGDNWRDLKWRIQRFKRGYSDSDTWNIDYWFCNVMPKMLKQLRKNTMSFPASITSVEWDGILHKMENGFIAGRTLKDASYLDHFNLDKDQDKIKSHQEMLIRKFDEGMELFNKYFHDLWD